MAFRPLRAQKCDAGIVFSGPTVITAGGTYTGSWMSTDPNVPAVNISTEAPVTIINSYVKGPGNLIDAFVAGNQLTVQNSCFVSTNPNVAGLGKATPIHVYESAGLTVQHSDFESGGDYGIWIQNYTGNQTTTNTITITNNRIHNIDSRLSDGNGGYLTNQAVFAHGITPTNVYGVPGAQIAWNQIVSDPYQSGGNADLINIYESSGTPSSPMEVHDNYLQGVYAPDPANANGLGLAGSGFTTDGSAQTDPALTTSYLKVHDNQALKTGNAGISIAIGHDIEMYSNRVVSNGQLSDGTNYTVDYAAGMSHWDWQYPPPDPLPANFGNNSVHDNIVGLRRLYNGVWARFDYYIPVPPAVSYNNVSFIPNTPDSPTLADEANEFVLWTSKLATNQMTVGSSLLTPDDNPAPSGPAVIAPANASTGVSLAPALSWSAVPGVSSYDVYFGASPSPPLVAGTVATGYSPGALAPGTTYYWLVIAKYYSGSASAGVWWFTTQVAPTVQSITVTPANPSVAKGLSQQFTATGNYSDGSTQNLTSSVTWVSTLPGTATISASGLATGEAVGTSTISATFGAIAGSAVMTVTPATLVSIAVTPANPSIVVGTAQQFTATGTYTDGSMPNLTGSVTWSAGTLAFATITAAGKAYGIKVGSSTISASMTNPVVGGATTITITPLGPCDVTQHGLYTVVDVQAIINAALGRAPPANDLNGNRVVNVVDIEIVINAALNLGCTV